MIEYIRQYNSPITIDQKLGHGDEYYHEYYQLFFCESHKGPRRVSVGQRRDPDGSAVPG